jgi:N-glycosylase/DNA lyase
MSELIIKTNQYFSFFSTIYSHGWSDLLPFKIDSENQKIKYSFEISPSITAKVEIFSDAKNSILINSNIDSNSKNVLISKAKRIFRLDEDLTEFYAKAEKIKTFSWIIEKGAGRMLRCASLWEDMVKMLCTTNCTWRLTQIMTENLYNILGKSKFFPSPKMIADSNEKFLRDKIKMGYRAPYLLQFARDVAEGRLNLDSIENWKDDSISLYKEIRKIKGFGDYAVSSLMKLLGRYDFMGFDSWNRKQFFNKHKNGKQCSDEHITKYYRKFGKWAGLFFWLDVTKDWYYREVPWK